MKIPPILLCTSFALVLGASIARAAENDDPWQTKVVWNNTDGAPVSGLVHRSYQSASIGQEVGYNVWLPPGYENSRDRYPVLYFLHGAGGNENSDAGGVAALLRGLIREKKISPVICVFPNGALRSGYRDHPDHRIMVETMIVKELVPLIDETYRTIPTRENRAIFGFSMGGGGAVRYAVKYPDLFAAAGAWGGAFGGRRNDSFPSEFGVDALAAVADRARFILVVGTKDFVLGASPRIVTNLIEAKVPFAFELLDGVEHDPGAYYVHSGEKMIRFLTKSFPQPSE